MEDECEEVEALSTKTSQISFYGSSPTMFKACFYCLRFNLSDAHPPEYGFQNKSDLGENGWRKYAGMTIWWQDDMMIWWYDDMMTWWYNDIMTICWCDDMMIWNGDWPDSAPDFIFFPSNFDFRISAEGIYFFSLRFSIFDLRELKKRFWKLRRVTTSP